MTRGLDYHFRLKFHVLTLFYLVVIVLIIRWNHENRYEVLLIIQNAIWQELCY